MPSNARPRRHPRRGTRQARSAPQAEAAPAEAPPAEAPQAEAPQAEPPQAEAPQAKAPEVTAPAPEPQAPIAPRVVGVERERPLLSIERALSGPGSRDEVSWRRQVKVVTGGQGPGKPDQEGLDRDRARLPLGGSYRIVVLGCTRGAGQTVTALMTGHILAMVRGIPVAALDLTPGPTSLAARRPPSVSVQALLAGQELAGQELRARNSRARNSRARNSRARRVRKPSSTTPGSTSWPTTAATSGGSPTRWPNGTR